MTRETTTYVPLYGLYQTIQKDNRFKNTHQATVKKEKKYIVFDLCKKKAMA